MSAASACTPTRAGDRRGWLRRDGQVLASLEIVDDRRSRRHGLLGRDGVDGACCRAKPVRTPSAWASRSMSLLRAERVGRARRAGGPHAAPRPGDRWHALDHGDRGRGRARSRAGAGGRSVPRRRAPVLRLMAPGAPCSSARRSGTSATCHHGRWRRWPVRRSSAARTPGGPVACCNTPGSPAPRCGPSTTTPRCVIAEVLRRVRGW